MWSFFFLFLPSSLPPFLLPSLFPSLPLSLPSFWRVLGVKSMTVQWSSQSLTWAV